MTPNNIDRNNPYSNWNQGMAENDTTLWENRVEKEKAYARLRNQALVNEKNLSVQAIEELKKLQRSAAEEINAYKINLEKNYSEQVAAGIMKEADARKKIQEETDIYLGVVKKRLADEDFRRSKEIIVAKQKAELDSQASRIAAIKQEYDTKRKYLQKELKEGKKSRKDVAKETKKLNKEQAAEMRENGASAAEIMEETKTPSLEGLKETIFSKKTATKIADNLINNIKQMFDNTIQTYGTYQSKINTRLQGSGSSWNGVFGIGGIESKIKYAIGSNPYVKLQSIMDNVVKATEKGIANNIEQRAFLATISENIAATFDAFDSNLLRIIRVQQADSTAARLGMEAGLTSFLNSYFYDNSYLNSAFDTVSENIIEATSQLSTEQAVGVEYQIQKWLGSLYSVGFSDSAVGKISQALGYLGSGNISALSSDTTMQNLIVMALNKAGLSYGQIMANGLDESSTNKLMRSMVEYLEEIASSDNKVVKSQYAEVFGMTVSDLKAAVNLNASIKDIYNSSMNYASSITELYNQMQQLPSRVSIAGMMQNMYDNINYSIGTSIASNPVLYSLWQITSMVEDLTGGIPLSTISYLGNSIDLNTTVTNLMRGAIVGVSTLGSIGSLISGLSSSIVPSSMLLKLGIAGSKASTTKRGGAANRLKSTLNQVSSSTYIGNSSGNDYYNQTLTKQEAENSKTMEVAKENSEDITLNNIHEYLLSVFDPKMTEVERLVALLAGYNISTNNWGSFKNDSDKSYNATTVSVNYGVEDMNKLKLTNSQVLEAISNNTKNIYDLLTKVIDDSGLKISYAGLNDSDKIKTALIPDISRYF